MHLGTHSISNLLLLLLLLQMREWTCRQKASKTGSSEHAHTGTHPRAAEQHRAPASRAAFASLHHRHWPEACSSASRPHSTKQGAQLRWQLTAWTAVLFAAAHMRSPGFACLLPCFLAALGGAATAFSSVLPPNLIFSFMTACIVGPESGGCGGRLLELRFRHAAQCVWRPIAAHSHTCHDSPVQPTPHSGRCADASSAGQQPRRALLGPLAVACVGWASPRFLRASAGSSCSRYRSGGESGKAELATPVTSVLQQLCVLEAATAAATFSAPGRLMSCSCWNDSTRVRRDISGATRPGRAANGQRSHR